VTQWLILCSYIIRVGRSVPHFHMLINISLTHVVYLQSNTTKNQTCIIIFPESYQTWFEQLHHIANR